MNDNSKEEVGKCDKSKQMDEDWKKGKKVICELGNCTFEMHTRSKDRLFTVRFFNKKTDTTYVAGPFQKGVILKEKVFYSALLRKNPEKCKVEKVKCTDDSIYFVLKYSIPDDDINESWEVKALVNGKFSDLEILNRKVDYLTEMFEKMRYSWSFHQDANNVTPQLVVANADGEKCIKLKKALKRYFKVEFIGSDSGIVGISNMHESRDNYVGNTENSWGLHCAPHGLHHNESDIEKPTTGWESGDIICVRIDRPNRKMTFEIERNGQSLGVVLTHTFESNIPYPVFPAVRPYSEKDACRLVEMDGIKFDYDD